MRLVRHEHLHLLATVAVDMMTVTDAVLMELPAPLAGHFFVFDPEDDVLSGFADSGTGRLHFFYQLFNRGVRSDLDRLRLHAFARMDVQLDFTHCLSFCCWCRADVLFV